MINKDFTPYQEAFELKQLGFDEPCFASYYHAGRKLDICEYINHGEYTVLAPTYSQAFRWFREKYHLIGGIEYIAGETPKTTWWDIYVVGHYNIDYKKMSMKYQPYEEAELACLKKLIEIVKQIGRAHV